MKFFIYLSIIISLTLGLFNPSFAQESDINLSGKHILKYSFCSDFLKSSNISDSFELKDSHCFLLIHESGEGIPLVLSDTSSSFFYNYDSEVLNEIRDNQYYKGEELFIKIRSLTTGEKVVLDSTQHIAFGGKKYETYFHLNSINLDILSDKKLESYQQVSELCEATSYTLQCDDNFYQNLSEQVDGIFRDILPRSEDISRKNSQVLIKESEKTKLIQEKFKRLKTEYQDSQKISFLLEIIDYKLHIYSSILEYHLSLKEQDLFLTEKAEDFSGTYLKLLGNNVSLFESSNYLYFYYKNTLVNTIQKDLSHFSQAEVERLGLSLGDKESLTNELVSRYSATKTPSGVDNDHALILKDWHQGPTTILVNSQGNRYAIAGIPTEFDEVGSYAYFTSKESSGRIFLIGRISKKSTVEEIYRFNPYEYKFKSYSLGDNSIEITLYSIHQGKDFIVHQSLK